MRPSWLALLLLVPLAAGQPMPPLPDSYGVTVTGEPTTLYFHLIGIQDFPINTQEPSDVWTTEVSYGSMTNTATCITGAGNTAGLANEYHTYHGFSSAGLVRYDDIQNGVPRVSPEMPLAYDVVLADGNATVYWYVRADGNAPGIGSGPDELAPVPVPNVVVRATLQQGQILVDGERYNGEVLAEGATQPVTLAGDQVVGPGAAQVRRVQPTGMDGYVYEFAIPLTLVRADIPASTGFELRVDMYVDNPACADPRGDGYAMPNLVTVVTGEGARPRMELLPAEPLRLEYLHPQFVGNDLVFHASLNSPWGAYDVDQSNATVAVYGPSNATSLFLAEMAERAYEYHSRPQPLDLTYVWPLDEDDPKPGLYTFVMRVPNLQGTAAVEATVRFEIGGDAQQELPGPAFPLMVLGLLAAIGISRRR